ncbi:MAG: Major Facilitator Superfamily protein [Alphaproteobacteria bacterium ADurb.Bin438]|nr:MAG: Major Facilitator Superfamily protein [Alphaproteobacteria bacterium ADurb.Bin438]
MIFKTFDIKHAPKILRLARVFEMLMFIFPVITLFYKFKGLSLGDFFLIQGIFSVFVFVLEIPTGYIGDLFSRKKVISLSFFAYFIGYLAWYLGSGFFVILFGEFMFALATSLYSGTAEAYLYDVLKKQGKEDKIIKQQGKLDTLTTFGTAFATFSGGFMYEFLGANNTILIQLISILIGFILTLYLPEIPEVKRVVEAGKSKIKDILSIAKYAAKHSEIKWLMLFPAVYSSGTLILMWGMQPLMENAKIPVFMFGIFMGINQFMRALFAMFSDKLFKTLKTNRFCLFLVLILTFGIISALICVKANNIYICSILLVYIGFVAGSQIALRIVSSSMINHRIKPDERATVLSVKSMFSKIFTSLAMISLKFMFDYEGLFVTFATVGVVILILTIYPLKRLLKLNLLEK